MDRREFLGKVTGAVAAPALVTLGAQAATAQENTAAVTTLKFWDMVWGPPEYLVSAKKLVATFNATHPTIHIAYQSIPWANWYQTFATAVASGAGPDISTGAAYQPFQFAAHNYILPVDSIIDEWRASGVLGDLPADVVNSQRYNGHVIGIPWSSDVRIIWYRKDLFQKAGITQPPRTWDEFRAVAKKLSGRGRYGFGIPADTLGEHNILAFMLNNAGGLFTPSGTPDLPYARNVETIKFLTDLVKDGSVDPAGAGWQGADLQKAFGEGRIAMMMGGAGAQNYYPPAVAKQMGLLSPLKSPHGTYGTVKWVASLMIYNTTKYPAAAKTFVSWLARHQLPFWTQGHSTMLPVTKSFSAKPYFTSDPFEPKIFKEWMPVGKYTGARSKTLFPQLNAVEGQGFMQKMAQEVNLGQDPHAIISQGASALTQVMQSS